MPNLQIHQACEHNLQHLDLVLPQGRLIVISGVSGSGKSSLAFDTLYREAQRRFLKLMPGYARAFASGMGRPHVGDITGLGPGVAVDQRVGPPQPRSTVGTLTEVWDLLRLAFARLAEGPDGVSPTRSLFSFNGDGACPRCQGLGVEDVLDLGALVADASKSLREGALAVTTPFRGGYLMYSQVTLDALDGLLRLHGGDVDTPWQALGDEARHVVFYGSDRLAIPLGKHTLETRLKWNGITARPQPEGFYRGLVPTMEEILRGKRNDSILRFARSTPCPACEGTRLKETARAFRLGGRTISAFGGLTPTALGAHLSQMSIAPKAVWEPIRAELQSRCALMEELGIGHLTFCRDATTLSQGEVRRLRLLSLALGELRDLWVVLDEPSAGMHPQEVPGLVKVLNRMVRRGQTVVVVDHDPRLAQAAHEHVVLGPGAGPEGGRIIYQGPPQPPTGSQPAPCHPRGSLATKPMILPGRHGLQASTLSLREGGLNVVAGPSGAGKTTLLNLVAESVAVPKEAVEQTFRRLVQLDASPIGRTPRSNPATYTGLMDHLRDLFAASPQAKALGLSKSHFSFNTPGGRCEGCEGAGVQEVGMRHLGTVELVCEACNGTRFRPDVLQVRLDGLSMADVLELQVSEALVHFHAQPKLKRLLKAMAALGLDHVTLGQSAMTLSGGEAQRIRLATELAKADKQHALLVLDEPATGLHPLNAQRLAQAFLALTTKGHTLLVADHAMELLEAADHIIELSQAGTVIFEGTPDQLRQAQTPTGRAMGGELPELAPEGSPATPTASLILEGVRTHNLKSVDVRFPAPGFTVVTGPSGSGKSSLVFDTLLAESQARFADLLAPWARRLMPRRGGADLEGAHNLRAAVGVPQAQGRPNPRSTVGTISEVDELLRLLFSRLSDIHLPASAFSPHTSVGACADCRGLGQHSAVDPARLITHPHLPVDGGALQGTRYGAFLGEPGGQFMAALRAAAHAENCSIDGAWQDLDPRAQALSWRGTGARSYDISWAYQRGRRSGIHRFTGPWEGLEALVLKEYERLHGDARGDDLAALLVERACPTCLGERLAGPARGARLGGQRLPELGRMSLGELQSWATALPDTPQAHAMAPVRQELSRRLQAMVDAGLGHLTTERPMATLSGGEAQRLRLATALSGGMTGVTYVLDEPTQGLHAKDVHCLVGMLRQLAREGNAVVAVEHHPDVVAAADHVLEMGPGAGAEGGHVVAWGTPAQLATQAGTYTASLQHRARLPHRPPRACLPGITLFGAHLHTLQNLDVTFPSAAITAVIGPSGSGKSTLVSHVLAPSLLGSAPKGCRGLACHQPVEDVLAFQQEGLTLGATSTVGTLSGVAEPLRKAFAATPEAKRQGFTPKHFSTASPGGRCDVCQGSGVITVAMDLLPDVTVGCEACGGRRFTPEVLACTLHGMHFADWLDTSVGELPDFQPIRPMRHALEAFGLGYITLGQRGATLSAGERQRVGLARLLAEANARPTAVLLDEPTRGLGPAESERLIHQLHCLADAGHMVVAVTHHPTLMAEADWIIELGPGGGPQGGRLMRTGAHAPQTALTSDTSGVSLKLLE